ncbi:MAG: flavin reductase [Eubacteriales bacterium]|nr:flavin reductase [Eubacteriales bacterium]
MEPITENSMCFFTQQPFLIGTYDSDGSAHFAPISWISFTAGPPCCLVISIYGGGQKKQTAVNIERDGVLSATVLTPDLLPFAEQHNLATQREGVALTQTFESGRKLCVPLLTDAKWSYECEVIHTVPIGNCTTYFAAFRQVNVREDLLALDFVDLRAINPVIYGPNHYFTVGEHLGEIGDYAGK